MSIELDEMETTGMELVTRRTVFDIPDTATQLAVAKEQATAVTEVIDAEKLSLRIGRSEHVLFEGWATLGAFNGISVHTVWTKPLPDGAGWEARAEARTLDGRVVGTAEAMCSRAERNWARAEDYAIRSMAQTRAGSKAFKGPLSWVMVLAGKSATPAEEASEAQPVEGLPSWAEPTDDVPAVAGALVDLIGSFDVPDPGTHTTRIGQAIFDQCDNTMPRCVASLIFLLRDTATPESKPDQGAPGPAEPSGGPDPGPTSSEADEPSGATS